MARPTSMRRPQVILAAVLTTTLSATAFGDPPTAAPVRPDSTPLASGSRPPSTPPASSAARAAQVRAAEADAAASLRESVLRLAIGRGLRVRDLVERTHAEETLSRALSTAQPRGGPRWVDEQTCQVQLTVPGPAVADAVTAMVARYPGGHVPVRPAELTATVAKWRSSAFTATGSSVAGGNGVRMARPRQPGGPWAAVPEAVRERAVSAAQADVVRQILDQLTRGVGELPLGSGAAAHGTPPGRSLVAGPASAARPTAAAALGRPAVAGSVASYLAAQPVTKVDFRDDLTVSVTIPVDGRQLAEVVRRAVDDDRSGAVSAADRGVAGQWDAVQAAVERAVPATVTGTASAAPAATNLPAVVLDVQPPEAFGGVLEADGSAAAPPGSRANRLKLRAVADDAATTQLRDKLLALRVSGDVTLAQAAKADPQLMAAVSRVMLDVRDDRVDWSADGTSVRVHAHLDLLPAWDQLRSSP